MSYLGGNYFAPGSNMPPACQSCQYVFCQCPPVNDTLAWQRAYGSSVPLEGYQFAAPSNLLPIPHPMGQNLPPTPPLQAFPHYGASGQQLCYHHGGRVMDDSLLDTFSDGQYAYGMNNEPDVRSASRDEALLDPVIQHLAGQDVVDEQAELEQGDLITDSTIDPQSLYLPVKVPCPDCGKLLQDEKSVKRHRARQHNSNVQRFDCVQLGCDYSTTKRADLDRHTRSKHPDGDLDPKPYKCHLCGTGSNRRDNLKRHMATCYTKYTSATSFHS